MPSAPHMHVHGRLGWRTGRVLLALLLLLGLTVAMSAVPRPAAASPPPLRIGMAYGDELTWQSDARLASSLDEAAQAGVNWIRVDLSWANIQWDAPDQYMWPRFDRVLAAAKARHLEVLPTIGYTPPWARHPGCGSKSCPPADPDEFARFARLAAQRYAPQGVHQWEVWNEPNGGGFWTPRADPVAYTALLTTTAAALRSVDPRATVVMGGLAALRDTLTDDDPVKFLTAVSLLGGNKVVDAIGYHPYTFPYRASFRAPWRTSWDLMLPQPPGASPADLRTALRLFETPNLPIWLTEYGAPTGGPGTGSDGSLATIGPTTTHVNQSWQATLAQDAVRTAAADPQVQALMWYSDRDRSTDRRTSENFFGLHNADGTRKPAYDTYRAAIAEVRASRPRGLP